VSFIETINIEEFDFERNAKKILGHGKNYPLNKMHHTQASKDGMIFSHSQDAHLG
jgi:hypothetical protein